MRRDREGPSRSTTATFDPGRVLELSLPLGDIDLFRHGASEDILSFLSDNPDMQVSVRSLADAIGHSEKATRSAVDVLEEAGLLKTERSGNRRLVSIARDRLHKPADPVLSIPQTEYQLPVRIALHRIREDLEDVLGVVLFGSVARGNADPRSDIDLWVLVGDDRQGQLHNANRVASELAGMQIPRHVAFHSDNTPQMNEAILNTYIEEIRERDEDRSSVQRHSFEILIETPETALKKRDDISTDLFREGITLHDSEALQRLKQEILRQ